MISAFYWLVPFLGTAVDRNWAPEKPLRRDGYRPKPAGHPRCEVLDGPCDPNALLAAGPRSLPLHLAAAHGKATGRMDGLPPCLVSFAFFLVFLTGRGGGCAFLFCSSMFVFFFIFFFFCAFCFA